MNPGERRIAAGIGLSLAFLAAARFLFRKLQTQHLPYPLEEGHLPFSEVVAIIAEIKLASREKLKSLRVACAEERAHVKTQPAKYEEVVLSYLVKESDVLREATEGVLARREIPKSLFDRSIQQDLQLETAARDLSNSLDIGLDDMSESVPRELTREVYIAAMQSFESSLQALISDYHGGVPVPPLSLVFMFIKSYDQVREKYPFTEFQLAAAGKVYASSRSDMQTRLQALTSKVMPSRKVRVAS